MIKFLNKPYPFNDDLRHNTKVIFFISIGAFAFMFLFQPFELSTLELKTKIQIILGIVITTFVSLSINLLLLPSILPQILNSSKWKIKKEILWNIWLLFTIILTYIGYYHIVGINIFDITVFAIFKIILMGFLVVSVLITINQDRLHRNYIKRIKEINQKIENKRDLNEKVVTIKSDYQKDSLSLKINSILSIKSAGNYIEVYWREYDNIKKKLVRTSLAKVEDMLESFDFIFKCHRSYLININQIEKIEGNYQGYKVFFEGMSENVPVSRNYMNKLQKLI